MERPPTKAIAAAAGALAVIAMCAVGVGARVRARVGAEAARRHVAIDVGRVRLGWFEVRLENVRIAPAGVRSVEARFDEVRVELSAFLAPQRVAASGGLVAVAGAADDVGEQLRAWRGAPDESGRGAGAHLELRAEHTALEWRDEPGAAPWLVAHDLSVARDSTGATFDVGTLTATRPPLEVSVVGANAHLGAGGVVSSARAEVVTVAWLLPAPRAEAPRVAPSEPVPPPLPVLRGHARPTAAAPQEVADASSPLVPIPDLHGWRMKIAALGAIAKTHLADAGNVTIAALSLLVREGDSKVAVGPAPLAVERRAGEVDVTFSSTPEAGATPLALRASLPLGAGDFVVSLAGGPVSLGLLGATEGTLGLESVSQSTISGKGRVALSASGDALTFDGAIDAHGLAVRHPRLASDVVRGLDLAVAARGVMTDRGALRLDDADATLGALRISAHGELEQAPDHFTASLGLALPTAPCDRLLESLPSALVPALRGAQMAGTLGAQARVAVDSRKLEDLVLSYDIEDHCKVAGVPPALDKERFTKPFAHAIYLPDGKLTEETTGPGTDGWTDLDRISPFMQVAVLTTEDGAFLHHHGFNHYAIRSSIIANLKARRFVRGASTITMQLAKNLFLTREKTLARKLEELILTDYLEQAFTKEEMMELYLNIIEFGPNVYGVTAAAAHYFGRRPAELNLAECLFLASILPSPTRYHRLFEKGEVGEAWLKHVRDLMVIAEKTGKISATELAQGLSQPIVFHDPKLPPPPPRPPVTSSHFLGDDPPEWQEMN